MRRATVVLPVPGLPVKDMCRLGASASSPRFMRSLSITSNAAMSRMRLLTGASPTRAPSSSSRPKPARLWASTSVIVRAPTAPSVGAAGATGVSADAVGEGACRPGIWYSGAAMAGALLACAGHGIAQRAAAAFLASQTETGVVLRPIDDEAHRDRFHAPRGIKRHEADIVTRKGLAAAAHFQHDAGGILEIEHGKAEHLPVGVARMRVVGVFDAPCIAFAETVVDLQRNLRVVELGEVAELALRDAGDRVGHHTNAPVSSSSRRRQ